MTCFKSVPDIAKEYELDPSNINRAIRGKRLDPSCVQRVGKMYIIDVDNEQFKVWILKLKLRSESKKKHIEAQRAKEEAYEKHLASLRMPISVQEEGRGE